MESIKSKLQEVMKEVVSKRAEANTTLEIAEGKCAITQAQVMYWEQRYELEATEAVGQKLDKAYDEDEKAYTEQRFAFEHYDTLEQVYSLLRDALDQLSDYEDWLNRQ